MRISQGAVELAQTAYLDNYEHLETPLGQLDPALKEATETMIMEDVQSEIETRYRLVNCNNWSLPLMASWLPLNNCSIETSQAHFP
jgi:hypothetical protein